MIKPADMAIINTGRYCLGFHEDLEGWIREALLIVFSINTRHLHDTNG